MAVLPQDCVDRVYLLAPALCLSATFVIAFIVYCGLCAIGHAPKVSGVKHNQAVRKVLRELPGVVARTRRALAARSRVAERHHGDLAGDVRRHRHSRWRSVILPGAVWLYTFAGILDVLDGRLARLGGTQSAAGALFDSVSDRWGELFVFAGYAWLLHDSLWLLACSARRRAR